MFKIKGYLKKFWYLILACICLLFVQAQTELTLPDYMSDIVSVGIQADVSCRKSNRLYRFDLCLLATAHHLCRKN